MFVKELALHVTRLSEQLDRRAKGFQASTAESCAEARDNLLSSIGYYREKASHIMAERSGDFRSRLEELRGELERMRS
jgi:endonuclease III